MRDTAPMPQQDDDDRLADLADAVLDLARKLDATQASLRDVPLTGTETTVIRAVLNRPRSTPTQVAAATGLRRSNVSTAVRALEAGGLVVREHAAADGRVVELVPTARAEESLRHLRRFWAERLGEAPESLRAAAVRAAPDLAALTEALAHDAD
ncbi:hypothetical protein CHMI_03735 [Cellulomonas hominis]|nr:hypothetical protein CHMI_03735 [Cellulomonas hominis]